ncbi:MAG TPA: GTPase ObgE [Terrimicrobiaceae bacterium]|nr:GTPase ObgE [Terrimicrobiaceae bacterium]
MKFVDQVRIHAKAGDGGNGCCSFRREKFVPRGGPNGGDGGDGGDIIFRADVHTDNLVSLYYEPHVRAERGAHGQGKDKHGRNGKPTIVKVPVGTLIYRLPEEFHLRVPDPDADADETVKKSHLDLRDLEPLADLATPGAEYVLCAGGDGGKGNTHFKSSTNRVPRRTTDGYPGEEGWFGLELKTIADAGLVGYPNAGKSTLLGKISAAHPKVAPYPFTTLNPVVGVVELGGFLRATVADIPGLIEGAHENRGLGHEFLRHIVRCKVLLFVLDMAGSEERDPIADYQTLRQELKLYDPTLATRPFAVIANKTDLPGAKENLKRFKAKFRKVRVIPMSAANGEGIGALEDLLREVVTPLEEPPAA